MKQILLFIVCLFGLGTMAVHAQENSEPTDLALYQQATKAIKDKEFLFKANLYSGEKRYYNVSPTTNYITLKDETVVMSFKSDAGTWAYEGKVKKFAVKEDKKGNINVKMTIKTSYSTVIQLNITIHKGSNHCVVVGNPIKYFDKFLLIGELVPYDISNLVIPHVVLNNRVKK